MTQEIEKNQKLSRRSVVKIAFSLAAASGLALLLKNTSQKPPAESLSLRANPTGRPAIPTTRNTAIPSQEYHEPSVDSFRTQRPESTQAAESAELQRLVERYGPALIIPAFEYHGDNYSMYDGCYDMNPLTFRQQMEWLKNHDFHAVSGPELVGFLDGSFQLPARSVILTTDSGNTSTSSIPRMLDVLEKYGMHFHTFIWTHKMEAGETIDCRNDVCWGVFREAAESGLFTIGSHSESHSDFSQMTAQQGIEDILTSKREIKERLGVEVYSISWPFESCPDWANQLKNYGFSCAFGGHSAPILECQVRFGDSDSLRWNLPRLLPPNTNGVSGRPSGKTLEEIMWENTTPSQ